MATLFGSTDRFIDTLRTPQTKEAAEKKLATLEEEQSSRMHRVSNVAMKVVATATMQAATLNTVYSIGNGISEGLWTSVMIQKKHKKKRSVSALLFF